MIHASFHSWWCLMNWKVKLFKQEVFLSEQCTVSKNLQQVFEVQSFGLDTVPQSFCRSFIALLIIRRSKSAQKFAVRVCRITIVVMETTQLVLSQFKNFSSHQLRIESCLSLYKKKSLVNCELVKLCHINCSGPFVWERHCIFSDDAWGRVDWLKTSRRWYWAWPVRYSWISSYPRVAMHTCAGTATLISVVWLRGCIAAKRLNGSSCRRAWYRAWLSPTPHCVRRGTEITTNRSN